MMQNWRAREVDLYDDFRPIYEPLKLEKKLDYLKLIMEINNEGWKKKLFLIIVNRRLLSYLLMHVSYHDSGF